MDLQEQIDKLVECFRNHETVTFVLKGIGETTFETIEFREAIETLDARTSYLNKLETAVLKASWWDNADEDVAWELIQNLHK